MGDIGFGPGNADRKGVHGGFLRILRGHPIVERGDSLHDVHG
jgi:hypothetical protein